MHFRYGFIGVVACGRKTGRRGARVPAAKPVIALVRTLDKSRKTTLNQQVDGCVPRGGTDLARDPVAGGGSPEPRLGARPGGPEPDGRFR